MMNLFAKLKIHIEICEVPNNDFKMTHLTEKCYDIQTNNIQQQDIFILNINLKLKWNNRTIFHMKTRTFHPNGLSLILFNLIHFPHSHNAIMT